MNIKVNAEATFNTRELAVLRMLLGRMSDSDYDKLAIGRDDRETLNLMYTDINSAFEGFFDSNRDD